MKPKFTTRTVTTATGTFLNKPFELRWIEVDCSYDVEGDFTDEERAQIATVFEVSNSIVSRYVASPYSYYGESSRARSWSIWDNRENCWLQGSNGNIIASKADAEKLAQKLTEEGPVDHGSQPSDDINQYLPSK